MRVRALSGVLILGAFAVILASVPSTFYDLERFLIPKELAMNGAALAALMLLIPRWRAIELGIVEALLAAFVAWGAVSAALAANPWFALRGFGLTFSAFVLFVGARYVARQGACRATIVGLAAAAALGGALGVAQAYGAQWSLLADSRPPGGTFGNRNFLAHLMTLTVPLFVLLALRGKRAVALLGYTGLFIATLAIVLTRSRAAWLGTAGTMGVMLTALFVARRAVLEGIGRPRLTAVATLLAAASLAAILVPNRLDWRSDSPYAESLSRIASFREGSGRARVVQYRNTLKMVHDDPVFGVGPGNWFVHYPRVTTRGDPSFAGNDPIPTNPWPSSDWIALLAERGVAAVLVVLLAGGAIALTAARRLRGTDPDTSANAAALLAMLAAAAITGAFDAVLLLPPPAYFVAVSAGVLLPETKPVTMRRLEGSRRRLAAITVIAIGTILTLTSVGQLTAIRIASTHTTRAAHERAIRFYPGDHRLRLRLMQRGPCSVRVRHARVAVELMPYHPAPRRALAACGYRIRRRE
jgi:O-antigen ligase